MPGRVLIVDPVITNRVVLKAQLKADFFTVDLASDIVEIRRYFSAAPPDAIILRYEIEEEQGFSTCKELKSNPRFSHVPIILICANIEDSFWDAAFQVGVEEVIPALPDNTMLSCRLGQLIRKKEVIEEFRIRQRTYADIGFAEEAIAFPPPFPHPLTIGCGDALRVISGHQNNRLNKLLKSSFPALHFTNCGKEVCNIAIIDEAQLGREEALQRLCELQGAQALNGPKLLYIAGRGADKADSRALELGADDFIVAPYCEAELAARLRRLGWQQHLELRAERQVSDRLRMALRDPLTGLFNRRYALQYLERVMRVGDKEQRSVTVMMLDLDNFKDINDAYGHQTGDRVICGAAKRLGRRLRSADLVARIGGEEFLVVLTDTPDRQSRAIAERMRREINQQPFRAAGGDAELFVSISIGVALANAGQCTPAELIQRADLALYQSKGRGRNQVTFLPLAA